MIEYPDKYHGGFANNFDLLRLILAASVVFLHFDHLVHDPAVTAILKHTELLSGHAVESFFVVSGFVVYMSFDRTRDLKKYSISRFFRLYPVYVGVVLLVSLLPLVMSSCDGGDMFSPTWWRYLIANLTFLNFVQNSLPCLFQGNFDTTLNGSLWTLKIEVAFYAVVPILFFLVRRIGGIPTLIFTYVSSLIYSSSLLALAEQSGSGLYETLAHQLPGQMSYFSVGIFLYLYYERVAANWLWFVPLAVALLFLNQPWIEPLALGVLVIAVATAFRYHVDLSGLGDLSYGIYVFHFPIIQVFLQLHLWEEVPFALFAAVLAATFGAAFLSSRLVERPSARLKKQLTGKRSPSFAP